MGQVLFFGKKPVIQENAIYSRQIHVMLAKGMNVTKSGVYRLWFDEHFYIGRSKNIRHRAKQHMKDMQRALFSGVSEPYQSKMFQYIQNNPAFVMMKIEVLEECTHSEIENKENGWITKFSEDPKCLNVKYVPGVHAQIEP